MLSEVTSVSGCGIDWPSLRRVLVLAVDQPEAVAPALAALQQTLPNAAITPAFANTASAPIPVAHCWLHLESGIDEQHQALQWMRQQQFDAACIFCPSAHSPFSLAYLCYLAGIPIRIGQSREFGGKVLSHCFDPPDSLEPVNPHLHLLRASGLIHQEQRGKRAGEQLGKVIALH